MILHWIKPESPSPKDAFCQDWLKLAQWFLGKRFLNIAELFLLIYFYLSLKKCVVFIWTNLNSHPRIFNYAKFGWNWPIASGERVYLMSMNNFCFITIISPWKGVVLHLNRLESPSLKNRPHGSGGEIKNVRSLPKWQTTDKFGSEKITWALNGSSELKTEMELIKLQNHVSGTWIIQ